MMNVRASSSVGVTQKQVSFFEAYGIWAMCFGGLFFLPYLAGTRMRAEVLMLLFSLLFPLFRSRLDPMESTLLQMTGCCALWTLLRCVMSPGSSLGSGAMHWINLNYPLLATAAFLLFRKRLVPQRRALINWLMVFCILNSLAAMMQAWMPESAITQFLYANYGGTISEDYEATLNKIGSYAMSNAEFLASKAGRFSGLMSTSHMLSVISVWAGAVSFRQMTQRVSSQSERTLAAVTFLMSVIGGMLSGGKMYYLGVAMYFFVLLIMKRQLSLAVISALLGCVLIFAAQYVLDENSDVYLQLKAVLRGDLMEILMSRYDSSNGYLADTIDAFQNDRRLQVIGYGGDLSQLIIADCLLVLPIAMGGVIGLVLYLIPFLWLARVLWVKARQGDEYCETMATIHVAFLISGIGVPIYQMGRLSPLFLLVYMTCLFAPSSMVSTMKSPRMLVPAPYSRHQFS